MDAEQNKILTKLAKTHVLLAISFGVLFISFFISNFVLAFLQEVLKAVRQFANGNMEPSFDLSWENFFHFQAALYPFYIGFYCIVVYGLIRFWINIKVNFSELNRGQLGTSEFEDEKNLRKQYKVIPGSKKDYKGGSGVIVSAIQGKNGKYELLLDTGPVHTMVLGISRSGKGERYVFPMLDVITRAEEKDSMIVNDPKGELAAASYATLKKRGYEIYIFNLMQQKKSMGFNPLQLVIDAYKKGDTSLAQQYANSVAFSLYHDPNAKDPFWNNSAKSLVTAIILAITADSIKLGKEERINMYSVANFLSTKGSDNNEETGENALDLFFRQRDPNDPARMMYATSNFAAGNTRASIFSTAMDKLQIFTLTPNAKLTSYNSLDLTDIGFGDKPVAVFMVTPDYDKSNHVLASIFVSQAYRVNAEKATMNKSGKMKRKCWVLLDEFGNMPAIEGMAGMITVGAGKGFRFNLIVQAYSQVNTLYGDEADTIIGNCSNQIYILTMDKSTAEHYSALIGTKTIEDVSRSGKLYSMDKSSSESVRERALLMPDELMKLKEGESIVVRANKRQDNKFNKIVPKPIFNRGKTAAKARYEYLSNDFDNSKSVLNLPIVSDHQNIDLSEIVFTADQDCYKKLIDLVGKQTVLEFKQIIRKNLGIVQDDNVERCLQIVDSHFEEFTAQQFFSFIVFEAPLSVKHVNLMIGELTGTLPVSDLEKWRHYAKRKELIEEDESDRWAAIASGEEELY
ncbi:VirD4-like conjugal transfer protein, CD1115 family [Bacillus licheniformis]|uniref:VirD4-like conjugal transfer protein, CD1115 family n=1 Tax=Bacillus licheniformis TaxID=1402 RepID=UPI000BA53306|nr:type IV secretory system conjugative DNA transfer family protein [Bacillus licheniformis]MDE1418968.1 type IV secretory system conjugative DNA transfer family protein [Bacillus licheniformis]PAE47604.1 type IV secretion system protein VirD4 [Bacillus licheniformis]PDH71243.1 type IV secretory pathway, VirD4 protein [Bacillus licheniformis]TWJ43963.1 Conjugal transfer protein TraG [Bacillus licheniformis]